MILFLRAYLVFLKIEKQIRIFLLQRYCFLKSKFDLMMNKDCIALCHMLPNFLYFEYF